MIIYALNTPLIKSNHELSIDIDNRDTHTVFYISDVAQTDNLCVDVDWHRDRYGFDLSNGDICNYKIHYAAWSHFNTIDADYCLIFENNVILSQSISYIEETILEAGDFDIIFPFDRVNEMREKYRNSSSIDVDPYFFGYKWGSSIYALSKRGSARMCKNFTIKQCVDDEILELSKSNKLSIFFGDLDWFLRRDDGVDQIAMDRQMSINRAVAKIDLWCDKSRTLIKNILRIISKIADQLGLDLILQGGTHLGYVRHGGIMPWDDDVDIGIEERGLPSFISELNKYQNLLIDGFIEARTGARYYKIWDVGGEVIEGHFHRFPFVDIWLYNNIGDDIVFKNGIVCAKSNLKPLQIVIFEGSRFKVPYNSLDILDSRYCTWRTGIRIYSYSHRLEKNHLPLLKAKIHIDHLGRFLSYRV